MVFKVFVYAMAGLGLSFIVSVAVGKMIACGNRRAMRCTVVWQNTASVLCSYTGTLTYLDEAHIGVEGVDGPVVIAKADVLEVL